MQGKNTCNRSRYKAFFFFLASVSFFSVKITYKKKKKRYVHKYQMYVYMRIISLGSIFLECMLQ